MARVSLARVADAARGAGFSGSALVIAVAITVPESRLNPSARGGPNRNGSYDYGLWQINGSAHPWITGQNWQDPDVNAAAAYRVYRDAGSKFTPWSTFKSGSYLLAMPAAAAAVGVEYSPAGQVAGEAGIVPDATQAAQQTAEQAGRVISALGEQETWLRVAKVMTGLGLIGIGVYLVARPAVAPITKVATKVATKGAT